MKHLLFHLFLLLCIAVVFAGCATTTEPEVSPEEADFPEPSTLETQEEVQEMHSRAIREGDL